MHSVSFICSAAKQQLVKSFFFFFSVPVGMLPSLASSVLAPLSSFHGLRFSHLIVCIQAASVRRCLFSLHYLSFYLTLLIYYL